jgi:DNA repair exonuclease SbcCD ATPase subunit
MIKAPPSFNSARINGTRYKSHLVNKNLSEDQTSLRRNKRDNDQSIKALIEKLMKNNEDLQQKLESKVNEVNKKNEMIEKLKDENEKFKKGLSNSENSIGMRMNHVLTNDD